MDLYDNDFKFLLRTMLNSKHYFLHFRLQISSTFYWVPLYNCTESRDYEAVVKHTERMVLSSTFQHIDFT